VLNERLGKKMIEGVLHLSPALSAVRAHCYALKAVQGEASDEFGHTLLKVRMPQKVWEQTLKRFSLDPALLHR